VIEGVMLKALVTHRDERGFFREVIRITDGFFGEGFGQWSHSLMHPGIIKAWHIHQKQTDWWYVCNGVLEVVLYDDRDSFSTHGEKTEIVLGDGQKSLVLKIPPGVAHGCKCIKGPANLLYMTSHVYNPDDEGRWPHDQEKVVSPSNEVKVIHDWLDESSLG